MKLALVLYHYFPYGGLQRDCLAIARACMACGISVRVYARSWVGDKPAELTLRVLAVRGWDNTSKNKAFVQALTADLQADPVDFVLGFNKMPGLNAYYAADECLAARWAQRPWWRRWGRRYRQLVAFEQAVFAPAAATQILLLTEVERDRYQQHYPHAAARLHLLPPGINPDRRPGPDARQVRARLRAEVGLGEGDSVLLFLGSDFRRKGLDRAILGLAALPPSLRAVLWVVGQDAPRRYLRLAQRQGVAARVRFCGPRDDVPALLQAADCLVHPARVENAGLVLVEALVAGLPVLTTAACGYAYHVQRAQGGAVLPEPFSQAAWNALLLQALTGAERALWAANAQRYGEQADFYGLAQQVARYVESWACKS